MLTIKRKYRAIRISNGTMVFKINLHNLKALFRDRSIHVDMPNKTKHKSIDSCHIHQSVKKVLHSLTFTSL